MRAPLPTLSLLPALLVTSGLLCSCTSAPQGDSYFPLNVGASWSYDLQTDMTNPPVDTRLTLSVDREVLLQDKEVTVRRSASGVEYYIRQDPSGIARLASRTDIEEQPVMDERPMRILPANLQVGEEWDNWVTPLLLQRQAEFPRELKYRHKALMRYRIESTTDRVEVPAGTFSPCLRIKGTASFKVFKDGTVGFADQPILTTEWYCRGVGLVQFDREEPSDSAFLSGGKVSYRLTDYQL